MSSLSDKLKLTFQLTAHDEHLEIRASAAGGEGRAETVRPPRSLLDQLAEHDPTDIPSTFLELVGKTLYRSLMVGDVAKLASDVLQNGIQLKEPVQFEFRFDADQVSLAQYPWEVISDDLGRFLVREGLVDVTRYITYPQPPPAFDTTLHDIPLLRVVSQPSSLPPITVIDLGLRRIETLQHATFERFLHKLLIERVASWGLQFDGHGTVRQQCSECDAANALAYFPHLSNRIESKAESRMERLHTT